MPPLLLLLVLLAGPAAAASLADCRPGPPPAVASEVVNVTLGYLTAVTGNMNNRQVRKC